MTGIFYIRLKRKLKKIHTCLVPDNAITYKLIGMVNIPIAVSSTEFKENTMVQEMVFTRVSIIGDEAMYIFDADKYIK